MEVCPRLGSRAGGEAGGLLQHILIRHHRMVITEQQQPLVRTSQQLQPTHSSGQGFDQFQTMTHLPWPGGV